MKKDEGGRQKAEGRRRKAVGRKRLAVVAALLALCAGFGWREMCRYVGREDWRNCLSTMQYQNVLRPPDGNKAADWNKGWSYSRFRMAMKYQHLDVPFPADAVVPFINWRKTP